MYQALSNETHRQSYFSSDQGGKTEVMPKHNALCPDIHRRGGFFQRRAEGKEQVYGSQDLVLGALGSLKTCAELADVGMIFINRHSTTNTSK